MSVLLAGLVLAACGGDDEGGGASGGDEEAAKLAPQTGPRGVEEDVDDAGYARVPAQPGSPQSLQGGSFGSMSAVPSISQSIIKTAQIELEVDKGRLDEAVRNTELIAARFGGFVFSTSVDDSERGRGSVVLRIPSEDFEAAKKAIAAEGEVTGEATTGKDVSQEFIDLEARIRNLEAQESVILGLIRVQNELSSLQLEIERLTGRLRYLEDRTAFGTIAIEFTEAGAPAPQEANTLERAWQRAVDVALAIASASIVSLGFLVPLGIFALLALLIFRQLRPRLSE